MIDFILVLVLSPTLSYIFNEWFNLGFRLKHLFRKRIEKKRGEPYFMVDVKPFDCTFCMYFWTSNIITLSLSWLMIPQLAIILMCANTVYAHLMNKYETK